MRSTLTPAEAGKLLMKLDRQRRWFERLHDRAQALAIREACLKVNGDCRKGELCQYQKRARDWPRL